MSKAFKILEMKERRVKLQMNGEILHGFYYLGKSFIDLHLPQGDFRLSLGQKKRKASETFHAEDELQAPMPGKIIQSLVQEGQKVKKGDLLLILEAMKMEHKIISPKNGIVQKIFFKEGERVSQGAELLSIE